MLFSDLLEQLYPVSVVWLVVVISLCRIFLSDHNLWKERAPSSLYNRVGEDAGMVRFMVKTPVKKNYSFLEFNSSCIGLPEQNLNGHMMNLGNAVNCLKQGYS